MRGRLIQQFLAEIVRLDRLAAVRAAPTQAGGLDPEFGEPVLLDADDDEIGERVRLELPPVLVPCQVEAKRWDEQRMFDAGHSPRSDLVLVLHFRDLERLGLVDPNTGEAVIQVGDRLNAIRDRGGRLVQQIRTPPGLYVTEARPVGFGLSMKQPTRNLLLLHLEARRLGGGRSL